MSDTQEWKLTIHTPIGRQTVTLTLSESDGELRGEARSGSETVPLLDLSRDGNRLSWTQRITRPMRLNLDFDVVVDGEHMTGTSRAGRLPSSKIAGVRTM